MPRCNRLLVVTLGMGALVWAANDPVIGTWKLNVAKSKYLPGPAPKSETRMYATSPDGIEATVTTVAPDGQTTVQKYPSNSDGRAQTVSGAPDKDGIIMTKVDFSTSESKIMHAGIVIGVARRTVSGDGKTMTITYEGTLNGEKVKNVALYERQ